MADPPPIPDTSTWLPRSDAATTLKSAFLSRCRAIEERIQLRARHEQDLNIDNFDSGPGVEDIVREELDNLLPARYTIKAGVLNDSLGSSSGDHDVVIFNSDWVPLIKAGATTDARRIHLPIEGVYAVGEVKQTLSFQTRDDAMKKLVIAHRLHRPPTSATRIAENRELTGCRHGMTNPLYSFILATRIDKRTEFDALIKRFAEINRELRRLHMVRALCVLGIGTVHWVYRQDGEIQPALFMGDDLHSDLSIAFEATEDVPSAFYTLSRNLMMHLYHSILGPEDIPAKYGPTENTLKLPPEGTLVHNALSRPVRSPSLPWDVELDLPSGRVDANLGAHLDPGAEEENP